MTAAQKVTLTPKGIESLRPAPEGKIYIVWDAMQPHLGVRVTGTGVKSFIVVRRRPGARDPVTHVIGKYPAVKLKEARDRTPGILATIGDGKVPRQAEADKRAEEEAAKVAEEAEEARRNAETLAVAIESFIADSGLADLRSGRETEAILRRDFLGQIRGKVEKDGKTVDGWIAGADPLWREKPVAMITRRDVIARLDAIKRERGKHAARHALGAIRVFYSWCVDGERYGVEASPCANVNERTIGFAKDRRELRRKRVLDDAELRDVWKATEALTAKARAKVITKDADADVSQLFDPVEPLVKLLMLTGQRLNDIAGARWREIDIEKGSLTVPPERYKMGVAQEVPLSEMALDILKALPRFRGYILTSTGGARPISGFAKMKQRLDDTVAEQRKARGETDATPDWVFHDVRRSVRTRLVSDIGVDAFVAERVLGHALTGLHAVYDQGAHRDQKRDALDRWANALAIIVGITPPPGGAEVVSAAELERARKSRKSRA